MAQQTPLISVIIPCYNYGRFLAEAVNSTLCQQKDGLAVEVIVVDDGSTDDTAAVAQGFGATIRYVHQENHGLSATRNTGIRAAKGDFLVFLDADDLLSSNCLSSHLDNFAAHPDIDASVCLCLQVITGQKGIHVWPLMRTHLDMHLCHSNIAPVHTFMLRSCTAREIGLFDPDFKACEDQDYWLRCAAAGKRFGSNPKGTVIYRRHEQSMTSQRPHQLAHDAAIRFKISTLLKNNPDFPRAGKFYGLLAHAAGTISSACNLLQGSPGFAAKLVEESAQAALKAASQIPSAVPDDSHLIVAERYFAAQYLLFARYLSTKLSCRALEKAIASFARRYPQFATMSGEVLDTKLKSMFQKMCCEQNVFRSQLRRVCCLCNR